MYVAQRMNKKKIKIIIDKEIPKSEYLNKLVDFIKTSKRGVIFKTNKAFQADAEEIDE